MRLVYPDDGDALDFIKGRAAAYTGGGSLYFRFGESDDDEIWGDASTAHPLRISINFLDVGTENIEIGYTDDGTNEVTEVVITKTNTGKWKWATLRLDDNAYFAHEVYLDWNNADVRLFCDGELYVNAFRVRERTLKARIFWNAANGRDDNAADGKGVENIDNDQDAITLLETVTVDLNTSTAQDLYTVPTGNRGLIDNLRIRDASISLTTVSASAGFNAVTYDDVIPDDTLTELTASDLYKRRNAKAGAKIGSAGDVLKWKNNILQGAAATAVIDVFGYLI